MSTRRFRALVLSSTIAFWIAAVPVVAASSSRERDLPVLAKIVQWITNKFIHPNDDTMSVPKP